MKSIIWQQQFYKILKYIEVQNLGMSQVKASTIKIKYTTRIMYRKYLSDKIPSLMQWKYREEVNI